MCTSLKQQFKKVYHAIAALIHPQLVRSSSSVSVGCFTHANNQRKSAPTRRLRLLWLQMQANFGFVIKSRN
jgi:hypothetical protein